MSRIKFSAFALTAILALVLGSVAVVTAAELESVNTVTSAPRLLTAPGGTVLYTVHSGNHSSAAAAFRRLVQLRNDLGLGAAGTSGTFVYLTQPDGTSDGELLIEVQIPVIGGTDADTKARDSAHLYRLGTTGVKNNPSQAVVSTTKPVGVGDPTNIYKQLYSFVAANRLTTVGSPTETFEQAEDIPETCSIDELETSIQVPVVAAF